ncbi:putative protein kinase domain, WW domain, protein kinase-like domain superfamily [Plasmopara halstedii]
MGRDDRNVPVVNDHGFIINGCSFNVDPKYHPIDAIGHGSYGVVCSVRNTETNEKLAIKKITPMAGDEWDATHTLREIRLMRCLGAHENIISLKDLSMCKDKDELYMMMELADTDLHRLIQSSCPLTEGHIRVIMYQVLSGVKAMHDNGVLHRDLKPGNLLLNKDCELKITDFGLARMMPKNGSQQLASDEVSMMTEYVVTRWYRPPELMLAPNGSYDGAIDMWSVGCILGELVSRRPLFPGTDFMDQLTRVFQVLPVPEPEDRGYVIEKDALKFLSSLPVPLSGALETKLGDKISAHALDLLRQLLCFNPKERISATNALIHPFFKGVQDEWGEIASLNLPHSLEFAFDTQSLPLTTLREYICDEVRSFNPCLTKQQFEDHGKELQPEKVEQSVTKSNNESPFVLEYDCRSGSGFSLKGCDFNVPSKYHPLQVLGEGSYGIVCAATDSETKLNVAIKKITPMAGDEWDAKHTLREIRLMRYFGKHPNIASLQNLSTCMEKDELYLMMELVDTDLHRLIQSKTKLEDAHIAAIMYQLLSGAHTLHENGVLHRDLKPGNILVSKHCDVKITDFGLSRYVPHSTRSSEQDGGFSRRKVEKTQALMTEYVVTRWYRPPEIMLAPTGVYNEAVDMWSIGCIFGELLNRRPLFPGTDFLDQLSRVFSVVPVPSRDQRGYDVEGDALAYLESLPPCSPSAFAKTFRKASPDAIDLLRQLLCVNPAQRISAKQALTHSYFKTIRTQLGEPPVYRVDKTFDFEFDSHDFPLAHLKSLIQTEVHLIQKYGLASPLAVSEDEATFNVGVHVVKGNENSQEQEMDDSVRKESVEKLEKTASFGPEDDVESRVIEVKDSSSSETQGVKTASITRHQEEIETKKAMVEVEKQNEKLEMDKCMTSSSTDVMYSRRSVVDKAVTSSLIRPKSALSSRSASRSTTARTVSSGLDRDIEDDDDVRSIASSISNNRQYHNNNGLDATDLKGRWGHLRSGATASTASSSRLHRMIPHHGTSTTYISSTRDRLVKTAPLATSRISRNSNNQQHARGSELTDRTSSKTESVRRPEGVSSTLAAATASSLRRQSGASKSTHTTLAALPDGWIRRIHSKNGREYYYDTNNKVASWKMPVKVSLDNMFCGASNPPSISSARGAPSLSVSTSSSPSSAQTPESFTSRSSLLSSRRSNASSTSNLPKEWARRSDPKTGRLFYVNLVTNRSYAKLPSSVTAAMLNLGRQTITNRRVAAEAMHRKKPTIGHSPQFTQMSWQRKRVPATDE